MRLRLRWVVLLLASSCALGDPLAQEGLRVSLAPADTALYIGHAFLARARMVNRYNDVYPSDEIRFARLDTAVSVTAGGTVTARAYGRARVLAFRDGLADTASVSVVPEGVLLLTSSVSADVANVDGSGISTIASTGQGLGEAAAWIPDTDAVVYSYGIPGGAGAADIRVADLSGATRLLVAGANDPRVSQLGRWVYFVANEQIERIHVDGTGREIIVPGPSVAHPDPSPDGAALAFIRHQFPGDDFQIEIRSLADSSDRLLTAEGRRPRWSPDGTQIAFWRNGAIFVIGPDGSNPHQVSLVGHGYHPNVLDWSPDGAWLVARIDNGLLELIRVSSGLTIPLGHVAGYHAAAWRW